MIDVLVTLLVIVFSFFTSLKAVRSIFRKAKVEKKSELFIAFLALVAGIVHIVIVYVLNGLYVAFFCGSGFACSMMMFGAIGLMVVSTPIIIGLFYVNLRSLNKSKSNFRLHITPKYKKLLSISITSILAGGIFAYVLTDYYLMRTTQDKERQAVYAFVQNSPSVYSIRDLFITTIPYTDYMMFQNIEVEVAQNDLNRCKNMLSVHKSLEADCATLLLSRLRATESGFIMDDRAIWSGKIAELIKNSGLGSDNFYRVREIRYDGDEPAGYYAMVPMFFDESETYANIDSGDQAELGYEYLVVIFSSQNEFVDSFISPKSIATAVALDIDDSGVDEILYAKYEYSDSRELVLDFGVLYIEKD